MKGAQRRLLTGLREHWVVLLGLVGVAALVVAVDPAKVALALGGADPVAVALMLPTVLLLYLLHGLAWWVALWSAGARVGVRQAVEVTFVSQAFTMLPGGDLWRVPIVTSESGEGNAGVLMATVVFDDLVYYFVLSFAMFPAAIRFPELRLLLAAAVLPQIAIFVILLWPRAYETLAGAVGRVRPLRRFTPQLALLGPGFRRLVKARTVIPVVVIDAGCALLAIALYGLALAAVHAGGAAPFQVAFTYAVGQVLSGLTVLPGALGAYEGMMTGMMAVMGVAPAAAAAAALLYRAVNDVLMAGLGLLVALVFEREQVRALVRAHDEQAPPQTRLDAG